MSFNEAIPSQCHANFETEDQFKSAAGDIAKTARANALALEERFSSLDAIADFVIERARSSPDRMGPSWWGYEAGVASGLIGKFGQAGNFLQGLSDVRVSSHAAPLLLLLNDPDAFGSKVNEMVAQQRATLKLRPLDNHLF